MRFPTPDLSCITEDDRNQVYEPAEDTFLLLDSLETEFSLIQSLRPTFLLEIGCGSGAVSTFVSQMLESHIHSMCTDINPHAARLTKRMSLLNGCSLQPIVADLVSCFGGRLDGKVDLLIFNPPYVVTSPGEVGGADISASWAGGVNGRQVLDRLLPDIRNLLSPSGIFYLIIIKENNLDDIRRLMEEQGLTTTVVLERRSGPEFLMCLRICREETADTCQRLSS